MAKSKSRAKVKRSAAAKRVKSGASPGKKRFQAALPDPNKAKIPSIRKPRTSSARASDQNSMMAVNDPPLPDPNHTKTPN